MAVVSYRNIHGDSSTQHRMSQQWSSKQNKNVESMYRELNALLLAVLRSAPKIEEFSWISKFTQFTLAMLAMAQNDKVKLRSHFILLLLPQLFSHSFILHSLHLLLLLLTTKALDLIHLCKYHFTKKTPEQHNNYIPWELVGKYFKIPF